MMTVGFWIKRFVVVGIAALPFTARAQVNPDIKNLVRFFGEGRLGDFALIHTAHSYPEALDKREYSVFPLPSACYTIPLMDQYYFVINTRHSGFRPTIWASFVTVVYHNGSERDYIRLYRDSGWDPPSGRRQFERDSDEIDLSPQKFIEFHAIRDSAERERARQAFGEIASQFHGRLRASGIDSWTYSPNVAGPIRSQFRNVFALNISLQQYQTTRSRIPERLEIVEVPRIGSSRFTVIVETPGLGGSRNRVQRTLATSRGGCLRR